MAWYSNVTVRYRGRLVEVDLRRGGYQGAKVLKGKPLKLDDGEPDGIKISKMLKRVERRDPGPFECPYI